MGAATIKVLLLFATSLPALSTAVEYQPIKITVNENFNAQPGQTQEWQSLAPNFVHQGASFYFNPRVQLPMGLLPPHIEDLITSLPQKNESIVLSNEPQIVLEDGMITEILKPVVPISEISIKEDVIDTNKIAEIPMLERIEWPTPEPIEVIVEENIGMPPLPMFEQPRPIIQELVALPVGPTLPPILLDILPPVITEEKRIEETPEISIVDDVGDTIKLTEIPKPIEVRPELLLPEPVEVIVEENFDVPPSPIFLPINDEPKPIIDELVTIPEAPILPPVTLDILLPATTEEEKIVEQTDVEPPCAVEIPEVEIAHGEGEIIGVLKPFEPIPETDMKDNIVDTIEISEVPISKPVEVVNELFISDPIEVVVESNAGIPTTPMHLPIYNKPEHIIQELVAIPEAPKLPPLSIDFRPPIITEEIKLERPTEVEFRPMPNIPEGPILQPFKVPKFQESFIVDRVPKPGSEIVTMKEEINPVIISQPQNGFENKVFDSMSVVTQPIHFAEAMPIETGIKDYQLPGTIQKRPIFLNKYVGAMSLVPFPKLNIMRKPEIEEKNRFVYSTMMKGQSPKLLKFISMPNALKAPVK